MININKNQENNEPTSEDSIPNRSDAIYKEIEAFKPYELTHCIAYEMGIRNENVKKIIFLLDRLSLFHKQLTTNINQNIEEDLITIISITEDLLQQEYQEYYEFMNNNVNEYQVLTQYIAILTTVLKEKFYMFYDRAVLLPPDLHEMLHDSNHIEPNRETNSFIHNVLFHQTILDSDNSKSYVDNYAVKEGYVVYQGAYTSTDEFDLNKIFTNFKRPMYEPNQIQIALNISLPKSELLQYIEKIKNDYDEKFDIKNPLELLGKQLDISSIEFSNMTSKDWADCFYIYDMFTLLKSQKKKIESINQLVQNRLTKYNGVKIPKTKREINENKKGDNSTYKVISYEKYTTIKENFCEQPDYDAFNNGEKSYYSTKTVQERNKMMQELINNLKYKTLILK